MYCTYCGKKIPDKSKFCTYCGKLIDYEKEDLKSSSISNDDHILESKNQKEKRIGRHSEVNLHELDTKVRDFLFKRKKQSMTKEDFALEDISDVKYMKCEACGENIVIGMTYCPKCGEKLPYADHSYEKRYANLVIRFTTVALALLFAGLFIFNTFIKKPSYPPVEIPDALPGGETVSPDYEYPGQGPMFFPAGNDQDDIEEQEEMDEIDEIEDEE